MSYNWKQFTKRIPIKASAKAIYDAWATQQGLESWFLRLVQFTKPDGTNRVRNDHIRLVITTNGFGLAMKML